MYSPGIGQPYIYMGKKKNLDCCLS